jgi:hypothetical protein
MDAISAVKDELTCLLRACSHPIKTSVSCGTGSTHHTPRGVEIRLFSCYRTRLRLIRAYELFGLDEDFQCVNSGQRGLLLLCVLGIRGVLPSTARFRDSTNHRVTRNRPEPFSPLSSVSGLLLQIPCSHADSTAGLNTRLADSTAEYGIRALIGPSVGPEPGCPYQCLRLVALLTDEVGQSLGGLLSDRYEYRIQDNVNRNLFSYGCLFRLL